MILCLLPASADQVDKCKAMVKKLTFPYQPGMFDNPTLQKFYSSLEAIALNKDEPNDVTDYTSEYRYSSYCTVLLAPSIALVQ